MNDKNNTGTKIPPSQGTGTMVTPRQGTGTMVTPRQGTGTAIAPAAGTGTGTKATPAATDMIPEYDEYVLKGIKYRVCSAETAKTLAKKSGEAKIFVVENGGRRFVIKLYIPGHSPNHAILDEVQKAKGGFLIDLYDHGRWSDPRRPGLTLDYEVMAYAPYGSLADIKLRGDEKRFREVAWRMAFCIKQCHDHNIVHRDIKPENFLFTDSGRKQFVISDFGIARAITGRGPVKVDTAKSSYFVSPEGSMSSKDRTTYVDRPTDYYSMGMTLLALWVGIDNFYALFPYDQLEELDRLKLNNKVISDIGNDVLRMSAYSRSLLERLLEAGDQNRAGFDEIKRWYEGETLKTGSAAEAAAHQGDFAVTFDETKGKVAHSREELAAMMLADREFAKSFIYRGMARAALQAKFPRLAAEIDDIPQRLYPRPDEQDTGVYAACLILDPSLPFVGRKGNKCTNPKELARELASDTDFYSAELAKKAAGMWAYLRIHGDAVKDLPERFQPIIARSGVHGIFALRMALDPATQLTDSNNRPVTSLKELSAMIWADKDFMAKRLVSPDDMIWAYMAKFGPNAESIAKTYPAKIKQGGVSEVYALCIALNREMPYYGKSGSACTTDKQIAQDLWNYFSAYRNELADPGHQLWQYLRSRGDSWRRVADTYPALLRKRYDDYGLKLIYLLDPAKPFALKHPTTQKWVNIVSFRALIAFITANGLSSDTMEALTYDSLVSWLQLRPDEFDRTRGALLEKVVKELGGDAARQGWYIVYSICPELGYLLYKDEYMTAAQIAEYIDKEGFGSDIAGQLRSPRTFNGSRLYQYLRARKMQRYNDGILKIIDVPANAAAHKSAPYNATIAFYKVIDYMGYRPSYLLPDGKTRVRSLDEVKRLDSSKRKDADNRGLVDYLAIYFHEAKGTAFSLNQLKKYYDFVEAYCPRYRGLIRSASARARVNNARDSRDKAWQSLRRTSSLTIWLCMVPMLLTVLWMIYTSFTGDRAALEEAFMSIGKFIAIGGAIIGGLAGLEGGIFGAIIGGLAGYWIPYFIFSLLSSVAPWILAALVITGAIFCIRKMRYSKTDRFIPGADAYNRLCDQADLLVITETFGTTGAAFGSTSSIDPTESFDKSRGVALSQRSAVRKGTLFMIILTVVTAAIGISLYKSVDNIERRHSVEPIAAVPADLPGSWSGVFHERSAEMTLTLDGITAEGTVVIQYSTPMTQQVRGTLDNGTLTLDVADIADAKYVGNACSNPDGTVTYTGVYTNPRKGTRHDFSFTKAVPVATEEAVTAAAASSDDADFITAANGVKYKTVRAGTGRAPGLSSKVIVQYIGRLPDGSVFDRTPDGQAIKLDMTNVIPGLAQGLLKMRSGGKAILRIPSALAYGHNGAPQIGVAPDTDLEYEVELLSVLS